MYQLALLWRGFRRSSRRKATGVVTSDQMTFFFTVYPANADAKEAIVLVQRFGQEVDRMRLKLPDEDSQGRVQVASTLPVKNYQTGTYILTVAVPVGKQVVARSCRFLLIP